MLAAGDTAGGQECYVFHMTHFGNEDEWQHFACKHAAMVEAVTAAHKATLGLLQSAQAKTESPEQKTILALGMACLKEFEEIVLLCGNGYGSGANKLLRTFFERVTTVGYLGKHPDKVQQFVDFTPVHWHKLLTEAEKKHEKVGLSEEEIAKIKADFEKVKGEYLDACTCGKKRLQGSWMKKPSRSAICHLPILRVNQCGWGYITTTPMSRGTKERTKKPSGRGRAPCHL